MKKKYLPKYIYKVGKQYKVYVKGTYCGLYPHIDEAKHALELWEEGKIEELETFRQECNDKYNKNNPKYIYKSGNNFIVYLNRTYYGSYPLKEDAEKVLELVKAGKTSEAEEFQKEHASQRGRGNHTHKN